MPNNFILGYDTHPKERQKEIFEYAIEQIERISEIVSKDGSNLTQDILKRNLKRKEKQNKAFRENVHQSDKNFYADDNCTSCGICEDVCPVNNIIIIDNKPEWQHRCQQCLACINYCPEQSIQFSDITLTRGRYHHPEITVKQISKQKPYFS